MPNRFITLLADILFNLWRKIRLHNKNLKAKRALNPGTFVGTISMPCALGA